MTTLAVPGYQIIGIRAQHRLGTIYEASSRTDARDVEILLLDPLLRQLPSFEERFLAAAREAMELPVNVRGIVTPLDAGSQDGAFYLVRAAAGGDSLGQYVERLRKDQAHAPLDTLRKTFLAIALRLRLLHERGIVHGNLTPAALQATRSVLLLNDLGLCVLNAREAAHLKETTPQILPYMSPEQMLGHSPSYATDIFSFGVVAYYLATGRLPRPLGQWTRGFKAYWASKPHLVHEVRPEFDPALSAIIHKALSVRPEHRFSSGGQLAAALQKAIVAGATAPSVLPASAAPEEPAAVAGGTPDVVDELTAISASPDRPELAPGEDGILQHQTLPFSADIAAGEDLSERLEGEVTVTPVVPTWVAGILLTGLVALLVVLAIALWSEFGAPERPVVQETLQETTEAQAAAAPGTAIPPALASPSATVLLSATVTRATAAVSGGATAVDEENRPTPAAEETTTATPQTAQATSAATETAAPPTATEPAPAGEITEPTPEQADEVAIQFELDGLDEIWMVAPGVAEPRLLAPDAAQPVWSPDGRRLAFTRTEVEEGMQGQRVYVITADGIELISLTDELMQIDGLTWSPDGDEIAYHAAPVETSDESDYQIYIANSDGSDVRPLTMGEDGFGNMWPSWSPTGMQILAHGVPESSAAGAQLRLFHSENRNMDVLYIEDEMSLNGGDYDWSPDGEQIVFATGGDPGEEGQLIKLELSSRVSEPLTSATALRAPSWSPDGDYIAFLAEESEGQDIALLVAADGAEEREIITAASLQRLFWSPSGEELGLVGDIDGGGPANVSLFAISDFGAITLSMQLPFPSTAEANGPTPVAVSAAWRPQAGDR